MTWDLLQANRSVLISGPELVRDLCFFVVSRTHLIAVPAGKPTVRRCGWFVRAHSVCCGTLWKRNDKGFSTGVWSPQITSHALGYRKSWLDGEPEFPMLS